MHTSANKAHEIKSDTTARLAACTSEAGFQPTCRVQPAMQPLYVHQSPLSHMCTRDELLLVGQVKSRKGTSVYQISDISRWKFKLACDSGSKSAAICLTPQRLVHARPVCPVWGQVFDSVLRRYAQSSPSVCSQAAVCCSMPRALCNKKLSR